MYTPCIHITDVGTTEHAGVDSLTRIKKQYTRLGYAADVIPAGHSPLHVAFTAITDLSVTAQTLAFQIKEQLIDSVQPPTATTARTVIALNCAPRNAKHQIEAAQEHHIFRIQTNDVSYLIYGPAVFSWVVQLLDTSTPIICDTIIAIPPYIADTSSGSQFRSAEYLPIAHTLELCNLLDTYAVTAPITQIDRSTIIETLSQNKAIIAPPDEYGNGRLLMHSTVWETICKASNSIFITDIYPKAISVCSSLTSVVPDTISVWKSSNTFPNTDIVVINLGTRWKPGTTQTTHSETKHIANLTHEKVGQTIDIRY
jgi:hypothetical protein